MKKMFRAFALTLAVLGGVTAVSTIVPSTPAFAGCDGGNC
jgi:hypothetical protein